jgi:heme exporter protein CcmD
MLGVFFAGKYAAYVWPAYGISLTGLATAIVLTWRAYWQVKKRLAELDRNADRPSGIGGETISKTAS